MLEKWLARISFSKQSNVLFVTVPAMRFFVSKPLRKYFQRRRTRTISLNQFQLSSIAMMAGAFVVGSYFTLSQVLIPMIRALTETTTEMPVDVAFDRLAAEGLAGYDNGGGATFVLSSEVKLATSSSWWVADYTKKKQLTVKNLSTIPLATQSATTQQITLNTKALYDAGSLKSNCEDLRVVFIATQSSNLRRELPRSFYPATGATNCSDSTATTIAFPLQEPLWANGGTSPNYELYYGNPNATDPNYTDQGYSITRQDGSTASATLVCPFNGTTTCVGGETPTTATGAIRYSGGSAMSFSGKENPNSYVGVVNTNSSLHIEGDMTIESWIRIPQSGGGHILGSNSCWDWQRLAVYNTNLVYANHQAGNYWTQSIAYSFQPDQWYHLAVVANRSANEVKFYVDGQLIATRSRNDANWPISSGNDIAVIGKRCNTSSPLSLVNPYSGLLDEVRISNTIRYTSNFTPQTTPFEPDANTKLLLHFDENGDDPRNTGKAIDSSGNGNHGTITGAKYVSGLVGVDNSSSSTGAIPASTYASHQGVFIEEGTTNLITNPSFENATSATLNWGTNYFNYATASATFTPSMAKRNSAGPFAAGPMVQGLAGTSNTDTLTFPRGNEVSGRFYQNFDVNQGSIVFWITPEWNGNDGSLYRIFDPHDYFRIYKSGDGRLYFSRYTLSTSVDVSSWVAGSTYSVIVRWDNDLTIDGTNKLSISVNDVTTYGGGSGDPTDHYNFANPAYIGTRNYPNDGPANAIIEGLTIYRRPLYDGQYGIDVGNGDEIAQTYNSGTGKDPTLVTGSWDVVFALPTNASTGALTTGTGNAWSHPHASNLLYTSTTNTGGFMMDGTYTTDGFADIGTPTSVGALATNEKIFSGGYKYTSDATNEGIYRSFSATNGGDYVLRALGHSDGTCNPQVKITRADGTTEISHLNGTTTSTRTVPNVYIFTWESPAVEANQVQLINTASSGTCYWHQVEVYVNKVNNSTFDSGTGLPWCATSWSCGPYNQSDQSTDSHSWPYSAHFVQSTGIYSWLIWNGFNYQKTIDKFYSVGHFSKLATNAGVFEIDAYPTYIQIPKVSTLAAWTHSSAVFRQSVNGGFIRMGGTGTATNFYIDDFYITELSDVSLTVTPANQTNSAETTGLRVDGADTLTQPITGLSADRGVIKFKFTPRHSIAVADKFGASFPVIVAIGSGNDRIELYKGGGNSVGLQGYFNAAAVTASWNSPTFVAGSTYNIEIRYRTGGNLELYVDNVQVATASGVGTFGTIPTTAYFGANSSGANQYDGTITSLVALTPAENTTAPYYKFGSKSVKLVNAGSMPDEYTIAIDPNSTATHTLSAYVYDGTTGNVGGTVASSSAKLVFGGSVVTPSAYTDMGGGWWRLTYSAATIDASLLYGVQAQAGKTIYVDGVQLEAKAYATTYADGSLGSGYSWSGVANESSGVRALGQLAISNSQHDSTKGSFSFWFKPNVNWNTDYSNYALLRAGTTTIFGLLNWNGNKYMAMWGGLHFHSIPNRNEWVHEIVTYNADQRCSYKNGSLIGCVEGSTVTPGNISLADASVIYSDLRIFNQALTPSEVAALYQQGLVTHSSGSEAVDRYSASGTYTSPVIDLGANGAWGSVPWSVSNILNGGGINYFTRTSMDNSVWSEWQAVTGSVDEGTWTGGIASDPRRYFQWKADLSSNGDQSQSPVISAMSTTYVEDSTPPANPAQVALGFANHASSSATLTSNSWYNYSQPKFTWEPGVDDPAAGQSSSGIDGYHVFFTTNQAATPSANLANPCYRFAESDDRVFSVGTTPDTCELSDADYYLRMQTKDNSGNVSDPVTLFTYKYDSTAPRSPVSVSSTTVGYTSQNEFSFYWPAASDQGLNQSGLAYYEYKTGATEGPYSTWTKSNEPGDPLVTLASNITAYQEGQNFFFVRTVDFAGNVSAEISNLGVSPFYYNESAPTAPVNVVISPVTSSDAQALENIFTVTWDKPASYSGELAKYYYCVNCTPSVETMTETTNSQTADRTLTNIALATQQGKNTFYLVAEDNNINTDTGRGNVNFEAYATAEFYASTIAPGAPTNLTISDASDRDAEVWRLTLAWKQAVTGGTPNFYAIHRSTDGTTFTKIGETTSTAYTDADLTQSQEYSYKVFAIDNANSTSLSSNIVTLAPEGKYTTPPLAGGTPNVAVGSTVATITWSTGRIAYGAVEYGKTTSYESSVAETVAVGNHSIKLTGLTPGTVYHYRVQALDDSILMGYDREIAYSSDYTFTTSALPTISNVEVTDLSLASAIINWSAVSLSSATIEYGESTAYGASVSVGVGSSGTYSTKLSGLKDSVTYHFRIRAVDIDGTDITSDDYTFTTLTFPKVTAVVFKTDQAQNATAINVAWSTNVPTTASVEYQAVKIDPTFASQSEINYSNSSVLQGLSQTELARLPVVPLGSPQYLDRSTISNRHVVQITNLSDSSLYVFTIRGRDEYGNQAVSDPIRYVTGADTKPPSVENLVIETPIVGEGVESKAEIVLSFTTDEPAFSQVLWGAGTGSEYPQATQTSSEATTDHMIVLRDLDPTSTYHLKIKTTDQTGNTSETEDTVVVTPTAQAAAFELILKNLEGIFGFLGLQ